MKIVCFGNGATGRLLVKQALGEGHVVTAFTRHPEAFPLRDDRLQVVAETSLTCRLWTRLLPDRKRSVVLDDDQNVHKALAVATVSGQPILFKFFLTEGIGKKAA